MIEIGARDEQPRKRRAKIAGDMFMIKNFFLVPRTCNRPAAMIARRANFSPTQERSGRRHETRDLFLHSRRKTSVFKGADNMLLP